MAEKKRAGSKFLSMLKGRPKPSAPRAGFKVSGSRYSNGGKIKK